MLQKADYSAPFFVAAALILFFIGGLLTTVAPPLIDASWSVREGCWYCHTQQIRTILADTKRYGWRGVDAPISTPDEFVYDSPHLFGTKRTGPDLARVGGKYNEQWHKAHFRNPADLVPGSIMPPFPWIADNPEEFKAMVAYLQTLGRDKNWRPDNDYEK